MKMASLEYNPRLFPQLTKEGGAGTESTERHGSGILQFCASRILE